ncbi:MAG: methyl-accepting chemotaxis protein [Desulfobulbaceae bacterium]|nr:methyl-accepting chemotaxis protein [Desulfobulbaceae bacterium]
MSLRQKLLLLIAFLGPALVGIVLSFNLLVSHVKIGGKAYNGIELKYSTIDLLARTRVNLVMLDSLLKSQIFDSFDEDSGVEESVTGISQMVTELNNSISGIGAASCVSCHSLEGADELIGAAHSMVEQWQQATVVINEKIIPALQEGDQEVAQEVWDGDFRDAFLGVMDSSKGVVTILRDSLELMKEQKKAEVKKFTIYFMAGAFALLLIVLLAAGLTVEKIIREVRRVVASLYGNVQQIIGETQVTSHSSQTNSDISSSMAAALEQTSASLEEITAMVRQNDDNASNANTSMFKNLDVISQANGDVEGMKDSMRRIKDDSDKISKIITEIEGIAFQTNLLALNAAVEAARAGEAGAGFAVVADEVRNLAQRTTKAAHNTQQLIEVATHNVGAGLETVDKVDAAMGSISESTKKTAMLIEEISTASHQQTIGISQISTTINNMESDIQELAAGSEELAAASQSVEAQTNVLYQHINDLVRLVDGEKAAASGLSHSSKVLLPSLP